MEFSLWSVRRRSVEWTTETLHQEVSKPRQLLDRIEVARVLNPPKQRRKVLKGNPSIGKLRIGILGIPWTRSPYILELRSPESR
jgi:hypothetical protein